jgi:hypothetical protein
MSPKVITPLALGLRQFSSVAACWSANPSLFREIAGADPAARQTDKLGHEPRIGVATPGAPHRNRRLAAPEVPGERRGSYAAFLQKFVNRHRAILGQSCALTFQTRLQDPHPSMW